MVVDFGRWLQLVLVGGTELLVFYIILFVFTILLHELKNNLNGHDLGLGVPNFVS